MSIRECLEVLEGRMEECKSKVEKADRDQSKINSAYHGGEVAGLNFAIARIREVEA